MDSVTLVNKIDSIRNQTIGITWEQMAPIVGYGSGEQLRSSYRRAKKNLNQTPFLTTTTKEVLDEAAVHFLDTKKPKSVNWREYIALAVQAQAINSQTIETQQTAEVKIETNTPVVIVHTGDWHLGDCTTDHILWAQDISYILDNEGVYMIDLGDDVQNMRTFKVLATVLAQVLSPKQQALLLRSIADELTQKNKLLAKVRGNHDTEFDERIFGEAIQGYMLSNLKAPQFDNRGLLKIHVGKELYTELLFHKSRFRSFMRGTHGAYREQQMSYPADIVAGAHDHIPAFEMLPSYQLARDAGMGFGGVSYLLKVGSYQASEFGWKYFHNGGHPMNIAIVLWPNEHRMQPFFSIQDAVRFVNTFKENSNGTCKSS